MRRYSLTGLAIALTLVVSLIVSSGAQAVVLNMGAAGKAGVALVPGSSVSGLPVATSTSSCNDPWLSSDLGGPTVPPGGLCFNGGSVMHRNETFALTWDPSRMYWSTTRDVVEQFMKDVANGSGTLSSPYALTSQYNDAGGRAANDSKYGGGCIDYGVPAPCLLGTNEATLHGNPYPASGCPVTGGSYIYPGNTPNTTCLTDAQIQAELQAMVSRLQSVGNVVSGYSPMIVLLTPPGVEVCLDSAGTVCSSNSSATNQFCSYHSELTSSNFAYVVQPWTAYTQCDEPKLPKLSANPTTIEIATDVGTRLVNPLSQAEIAAIVNPRMDGWFSTTGAEINDNGCAPAGPDFDTVTVGGGSYVLQREFNNGGVIETDPNALACAPWVNLGPAFVVPSTVNTGDVVALDGSTTNSTLVVPSAGYQWDFGDGSKAVGPSVVHSYTKPGTYTITLTTTDRGGYKATSTQLLQVLGSNGGGGGSSGGSGVFYVRMQLLPQSLKSMLRSGLAVRVTSTRAADGIVTLSISRKAARRAHIKAGRGPSVVIAKGTLSQVKDGTVNLHLHLRLARSTANKLKRLGHVTVTVRLALAGAGGGHVAIDAAARY